LNEADCAGSERAGGRAGYEPICCAAHSLALPCLPGCRGSGKSGSGGPKAVGGRGVGTRARALPPPDCAERNRTRKRKGRDPGHGPCTCRFIWSDICWSPIDLRRRGWCRHVCANAWGALGGGASHVVGLGSYRSGGWWLCRGRAARKCSVIGART